MCVHVDSGKTERVMWQSRGELPLLDYVKHSHSPEVTALLWKLKVSRRFTAFVSRRLSHPLRGPAPTRYTPHGRLLWTTTATSAIGMSICLHREEGCGEGKSRGLEMECWFGFKLAVIDGIWHWGGGWWGGGWLAPPLPASNGHTDIALNPDSNLI